MCVSVEDQQESLASLSDSSNVKISPSLIGPLTFLMMERFVSSKKLHCDVNAYVCIQLYSVITQYIYVTNLFLIFFK